MTIFYWLAPNRTKKKGKGGVYIMSKLKRRFKKMRVTISIKQIKRGE